MSLFRNNRYDLERDLAALPANLRTRINGDVVAILGDADLKQRLAKLGASGRRRVTGDW